LQLFDRKVVVHPSGETSVEWAYAHDTAALELERHPGARRLVRSGAVEHDLAIPRQLAASLLNLLGGDPQCAGDGGGPGGQVQERAGVEARDRPVARLEPALELLGHDPRDPETPEEALALDELDEDVAHERAGQEGAERVAQTRGVGRDQLQRVP